MLKSKKPLTLLEKVSRYDTVYTYSDIDTGICYLIDNPSYMPDVVTLTDGTLDKPVPISILLWRMPVILPFVVCAYHIQMRSILIALLLLIGLWLASTLHIFALSVCYLRTFNVTRILWHGGNRHEEVDVRSFVKT